MLLDARYVENDGGALGEIVAIDVEDFRAIPVRGDGSCVLLDLKTNQCSIYEDRPYRCKCFSCWDDFVNKRIPLDDPMVDELLQREFPKHSSEEYVGLRRRIDV